jgi:hypothetical protein
MILMDQNTVHVGEPALDFAAIRHSPIVPSTPSLPMNGLPMNGPNERTSL